MRTTWRMIATAATLGIATVTTGYSGATDPVVSTLWNQVDDAEAVVYDVLNRPSPDTPTIAGLPRQLADAAVLWDGEEAPTFSDDGGTPVIYNYQDAGDVEHASFDLFIASGVDEHFSILGWLDSRPSRIYTCYRIEVSFMMFVLWDYHRSHDFGDDALACPSALVRALGDGAQYREPALFDG